LAEALRARCGIASSFLVAAPSWTPEDGKRSVARIPGASPDALIEALEKVAGKGGGETAVLLHYANYGYEPRGCPSWLVEGLRMWKGRNGGRLVTLFHEVHAMGPPWRSSFWLSPVQRRLAATLARLSDGLATSMRLYQRILARWVPGREVAVLPVFSTVGEPREIPPLAERARRLVVFGGVGTRARAYRELGPAIEHACRDLGIEELYDVGPGDGPNGRALPVRVRRLGPLPETEVSALLLGSVAGFVGYPPPFLPKSTIFAAYCAHQVLPICAWPSPRREAEPLPPFWTPQPRRATDWDELQEIAARAHAWYNSHDRNRHAASHMRLLFPDSR